MKTFIAAIGTAIVLAGSASAMVIPGDNLPSQPGGQSQFSTMGHSVERDVSNPSNSPAGVYAANGVISVSVFETQERSPALGQGGEAR